LPFEFLGTFNKSQFDRFAAYARDQLAYVDARIAHLTYEQTRVGFLRFTFDPAGKPTAYSTGSSGSSPTYIGKLMAAYEALGGDPFFDLQTRTMGQPVFYPRGTEVASNKVMSNGEPLPAKGLADAPSAKLMGQMQAWMYQNLERRAKIERKVRRALDYADQLQAEIEGLTLIKRSVEVDGSLENMISAVNLLLADPHYRALGDDKGADPFGKLAYAPYASYEPGEGRNAPDGLVVERVSGGYSISGEGGSTTL